MNLGLKQTKIALSIIIEKVHISRYLIDTLISLVGVNLFIAGLSFVTTIMIANALGREKFGDLSFAIAVGSYGLIFIQYGLDKSFVRELVHFPNRFGELLKASLLLKSMLFVLFLFFLVVVVALFLHHSGFSLEMVPVILATAFAAFQLNGVYDAWREMKRHAVYHMIERCIYFALVWFVIFVPFTALSLGLIGAFMMMSTVTGLFLQYHWALPRINFKSVQGTWPSTIFIIRSDVFIWLAVLSGLSIEYLSQIILKWYAGSSELGVYSVAIKIPQLAILFLSQAGRIGAEATARHTVPETNASARLRFLVKYAGLMTAIGLMVGLPCILLPEYILMVFRPEYANAADTLRLFGFYPLMYGPYLVLLQYVISSRMQRTYFMLITTAGIISIGLSFWLIPQMHSKGAAISVNISLAVALTLFVAAVGFHLKSLKKLECQV
jgi:O-antigen/teichoic acid export membrane protein